MTRVEQIGDCTLMLGDCREILPTLGKVDAVVTDPPYGIGFKQRTTGIKIIGDDVAFDPSPLFAVCDEFFIWGANHFTHDLPRCGQFHVWLKRAVEVAAPKTYSDCEIAWHSHSTSTKCIRMISDGCIRQGVDHGIVRLHPSQKPQEVMEWSLGFVPNAHVILDPFMGSGTTGVACVKLGRKFIGIEISEEYFDISCRRIEKAYAQPDLFVDQPKPEAPKQFDLLGETA